MTVILHSIAQNFPAFISVWKVQSFLQCVEGSEPSSVCGKFRAFFSVWKVKSLPPCMEGSEPSSVCGLSHERVEDGCTKLLPNKIVSNKISAGERSRTKNCTYKKIIATTSRLIQLTETLKTHIIHTYTTRDTMNNTNMAISGK